MQNQNYRPSLDDEFETAVNCAIDSRSGATSGWRSVDTQVDRRWVSEALGLDSRQPGVATASGRTGEGFVYHPVTPATARNREPMAPAQSMHPEAHRRRGNLIPEALSATAAAWLAAMPEAYRPVELPRRFARIVNKLCGYWFDPAQWNRYLAGLLIDDRDGMRQGFPPVVAAELARLHSVHDQAHIDLSWGGEKSRRR